MKPVLKQCSIDETMFGEVRRGLITLANDNDALVPLIDAARYVRAQGGRETTLEPTPICLTGDSGEEWVSVFHSDIHNTLFVLRTRGATHETRIFAHTYGKRPFLFVDAVQILKYHKETYTLHLWS